MECMSSCTVAIYWGRVKVFSGNVDTRVSQPPRKTPTTYIALSSVFTGGHLKGKTGIFLYKWNLILSVCSYIVGISSLFRAWGWVRTLYKILLPVFVLWCLMSTFSQGFANGGNLGFSLWQGEVLRVAVKYPWCQKWSLGKQNKHSNFP